MVLNDQAHGGPAMSGPHERMADLKTRLKTDPALGDPQARCKLYYGLFHAGFGGNEYWNDAEYKDLGCAGYGPYDVPDD
jgi:hypothetical protein